MLEWNSKPASIDTTTPYGTYKIRMTADAVEVHLESTNPVISFVGQHNTIAAAKAAAIADEEYRTHMWEAL